MSSSVFHDCTQEYFHFRHCTRASENAQNGRICALYPKITPLNRQQSVLFTPFEMQSGCENAPKQSNPGREVIFFRFKFTKVDRFLNRNDRTDTGHSRQKISNNENSVCLLVSFGKNKIILLPTKAT